MLFHLSKPCFFLYKRSDSTCLQKALITLKNMLHCVVQYRSLKMILLKIYFLYLYNVVYIFYLELGSNQSQTGHGYIMYTSGNCLVHKLPETLYLFFYLYILYTYMYVNVRVCLCVCVYVYTCVYQKTTSRKKLTSQRPNVGFSYSSGCWNSIHYYNYRYAYLVNLDNVMFLL